MLAEKPQDGIQLAGEIHRCIVAAPNRPIASGSPKARASRPAGAAIPL
jgi:hypothetical protein